MNSPKPVHHPIVNIQLDHTTIPNLTNWVETHVGGEVVKIERQSRFRPVWLVDLRQGDAVKRLLVKGDRTWNINPISLADEAHLMQVLYAEGIRQIPFVYGVCENPVSYVMDFLEGERNTDLVRTTIAQTSLLSDDRKAASLHYMDILAQIHAIDPEKFVPAGAILPTGAREIALANAERYAVIADDAGIVEPSRTFMYNWIRRNVPEHRVACSFVTGDCGQFLNKGPEVSAVLDMEMAHLGDPLHDLACFRGRHPAEDLGDISAMYARYAETTETPIDIPVLAYQTVVFHSLSLVAAMLLVREQAVGGSWIEAAMQLNFIGRRGIEAMADIEGVELEDLELPARPRVTPTEDLALASLIREIENLPLSESFADWQRDIILDIPKFMLNQAHYGQWATDEDIGEIAAIVGRRYDDIEQANKALNDFILSATPDSDSILIQYFHRSFLRQCLLFAGPEAPKSHLLLHKMEPIMSH